MRDALRKLGDGYVAPSTVDDTGTKWVMADVEEQKGHEDIAANIRYRMLEARLTLLERRKAAP